MNGCKSKLSYIQHSPIATYLALLQVEERVGREGAALEDPGKMAGAIGICGGACCCELPLQRGVVFDGKASEAD